MPKLLDTAGMNVAGIPGLSGYQFSAVSTDRLGASEYTLVTIALDGSSSVSGFRDLIVECLNKATDACRKSPRAGNIMVRVISFATDVVEIHGFKPLAEIDPSAYDRFQPRGNTALFDAAASAIGAMTEYGRVLQKQDYGVNGILFVITDGDDNASTYDAGTVKAKAADAVSGEVLESFLSVLIGVNAAALKGRLMAFQQGAGITQYVDAGDATPGNLAKLAAFVSRSVSSQANAIGTGQAAQLAAPASVAI